MATRPRSTVAKGYPSIITPSALDLRALQDAIEAARERIEKVEAAADQATSPAQLEALKTQLTSLRVQFAALVNRVAQIEALLGIGSSTLDFVSPDELAAALAALPPAQSVLYDNTGRALLTGSGQELFVGA